MFIGLRNDMILRIYVIGRYAILVGLSTAKYDIPDFLSDDDKRFLSDDQSVKMIFLIYVIG